MVNCDLCETDWLLGAAGTCNITADLCVCPDGFTGIDDWFVTDTCHVNLNLAYYMLIVSVGIGSFSTFVSGVSVLLLYRRWNATDENVIKKLTRKRSTRLGQQQAGGSGTGETATNPERNAMFVRLASGMSQRLNMDTSSNFLREEQKDSLLANLNLFAFLPKACSLPLGCFVSADPERIRRRATIIESCMFACN